MPDGQMKKDASHMLAGNSFFSVSHICQELKYVTTAKIRPLKKSYLVNVLCGNQGVSFVWLLMAGLSLHCTLESVHI